MTRLFKVEEAAGVLGVGRTKIYAELAAGRIFSVSIGASRRIPAESIDSYVELLKAEASNRLCAVEGGLS